MEAVQRYGGSGIDFEMKHYSWAWAVDGCAGAGTL